MVVVTILQVWAWCEAWVDSHPTYSIVGDNCQMFVRDFLKAFCGVSVRAAAWKACPVMRVMVSGFVFFCA